MPREIKMPKLSDTMEEGTINVWRKAEGDPVAKGDVLVEIETMVNDYIRGNAEVETRLMSMEEAMESGAIALFGEKYGDKVRVVRIPDVSMELCGGTHVRHTGEIGLFRILGESGVAAGVRRIEAATGPGAFRYMEAREGLLREAAETLRTPPENVPHRAEQLLQERANLEGLLSELRRSGFSR